jgi:hypothetical protein
MRRMNKFLATCLGVAPLLVCSAPVMAMESDTDAMKAQIAALKSDIELLKGQIPSQSHAMTDVDYQFTNLWFAAQERNWPLATFYLNETRSHIEWTVRLRPVRKLASGQDLDLRPLLQAIQQSGLTELRAALDKHDNKAIKTAYEHTLNECYSCHLAAEKPFLHPAVPTGPATHIIQMHPGG